MEHVGIITFALYALISAIGGLLVGMIGTGSSLILLPCLIFVFSSVLEGFDTLRIAAGTTMATIAVGAIAGAIAQYRSGNVDLRLVRLLVFPYSIGALLGPWLSGLIQTEILEIYIAALLAVIAYTMLFRDCRQESSSVAYSEHLVELRVVLTGVALMCSLAGIASGVLAIPYLMRFSLSMRTIVGTSTAGAAIYASFGAIGYVLAAPNAATLPPAAMGYVYLPAFAIMAGVAMFVTPMGVYLGRYVNEVLLRRIFAAFLIVASLTMVAR